MISKSRNLLFAGNSRSLTAKAVLGMTGVRTAEIAIPFSNPFSLTITVHFTGQEPG